MNGLEVLTPAEMAQADRLTVAGGMPGRDLMERAGRAVADDLALRIRPGARVVVFCGPGNNGGDGFVAARHLARRGFAVRLGLLGDRVRLSQDAASAAALWAGPVEPATPHLAAWGEAVVDALFGAGLGRDLDGEAAALVSAINASRAFRLAIDLPSGVDGTTGAVRGVAVRAHATTTFFRPKPGHLLHPGRDLCGRVRVADIGIAPAVLATIRPRLQVNGPHVWEASRADPGPAAHKYARGHVVVLSGPKTATGAARLAAAAALRAGAGAATIASPADALAVNAAHLTAVMLREVARPDGLADLLLMRERSAGVIGPGAGVGEGTRAHVRAALATRAGLVLDADALTSFAAAPEALFDAVAGRTAPVVLTPHEGEFARLFPDLDGIASKVDRARAAAARSGSVVLLKGADTVVAHPQGAAVINANAPPELATAGSGDVLAGIVAAGLAAGMQGFAAAAWGAHVHGRAGVLAGPGLTAEDLVDALRLAASEPGARMGG